MERSLESSNSLGDDTTPIPDFKRRKETGIGRSKIKAEAVVFYLKNISVYPQLGHLKNCRESGLGSLNGNLFCIEPTNGNLPVILTKSDDSISVSQWRHLGFCI